MLDMNTERQVNCPMCGHSYDPDEIRTCDGNGEAGTQALIVDDTIYSRYESTCDSIGCGECLPVCSESDHAQCDSCTDKMYAYYSREYKSGRLGKAVDGQYADQDRYDKMAQDDPLGFYIACKEHPETLDDTDWRT